jgi:ferredoxin-type protein NapH
VGLVLLLPAWLGWKGIPFEEQVVSICRLCPAGALEAGVPFSAEGLMAGKGWAMSWYKSLILLAFFASALFVHRPWCRLFCPLGGLLALGNRFSLFHLRFKAKECIECNLCRSRCSMGVKVDQKVNVSGCIRCLECLKCGAIQPSFALPGREVAGEAVSKP